MSKEKKPLSYVFDNCAIIYAYVIAVVILYAMGIMFYMIIGPWIAPEKYLEQATKACEYMVPLVIIKIYVGAGLIWLSIIEVSLRFILNTILPIIQKLKPSEDEQK